MHDRCVSLGSVARASRSARFRNALLVRISVERFGMTLSRLAPIRETLLLESRSVPSLGRRGKPSRVRTPLSERSMESNWFCRRGGGRGGGREVEEVEKKEEGERRRRAKRRSNDEKKTLFLSFFSPSSPLQHEPLSRPRSRSLQFCCLWVIGRVW